MGGFRPFAMERWQSTWENRVEFNLSESGVHPLSVGELLELAGSADLGRVRLGYGQSNGTEELRARVAALYPGAGPDRVVVTNGSAEANFVALWELVRPGRPVVILLPTYMQAHGLVSSFGGELREVWLQEERGWQADPQELEDAIGDDATLVVVTNPNNPTGARLSPEARAAIVRGAERSGAWILADEVYSGAELTGPETPTFWGATERVVATGSLSKAYGLPGLRVGWAVAPSPEAAEGLWARSDYTTIAPATLSDHLARLALHPRVRPRILERTRGILRENLPVLLEWLERTGGFQLTPPEAGAIAYARYQGGPDSPELAERLRVEASVLVVPGSHFGMGRYVRFGFGIPRAELGRALDRFGDLLAALRSAGSARV